MRCRLATRLFLALALPLATPVLAQVQVSGQASGFRYVLGDLAPGDAAAPEVKLSTTHGPGVSSQLRIFDWEGNIHDDNQVDDGPGSLLLDQAWGPGLRSRTGYEVGGASPVLGWSLGIAPHDQLSTSLDVTSAGPWMAFELSPNTSITFELDAAVQLSMAPETDTEHWRGTSLVALMVSAYHPRTGSFWGADELRGWVGATGYGPYQLEDAKDGLLTVTYTNTSNDWVRGDVGHKAWAFAMAFNDVPPVPEPSVWAMYAAGIALLGTAGRIRRRGAPPSARSRHCGGPASAAA